MTEFWNKINLPTQDDFDDIEYVNPASAYRLQVDAVNMSSQLYAELEEVDEDLRKAESLEQEITRSILAQNMADLKGTQTRTNDLVDAFVYAAAEAYVTKSGHTKNVQPILRKVRRKIDALTSKKEFLERRLRAVNNTADICDRVLNWNKHLARLELGRNV